MPRLAILLTFFGLLPISGCGPQVAQEHLGTLEFRVPHVPGSETPYPLDQLKEPKAVERPALHGLIYLGSELSIFPILPIALPDSLIYAEMEW